jgi:putative oxidoreductase
MKFLNALQPLSLLVLRMAFAVTFIAHGYPTLAHRSSSVHTMFLQHGIPVYWVYISGVLEVFGAGLLAMGLFTRVTALLLASEMVLMIWKVQPPHSYFTVDDYAYPMVVAAGCFVLATSGAGVISLDHPMFESRSGGKWKAARNGKPGK